jgi:hypothetical protein
MKCFALLKHMAFVVRGCNCLHKVIQLDGMGNDEFRWQDNSRWYGPTGISRRFSLQFIPEAICRVEHGPVTTCNSSFTNNLTK